MEILELKTASLFRFAAEAGGLLSGASSIESKALAEFGAYLGMAFQLVDDALDYNSKETGKSLLADLQEGKLTLPLVLAAKIHPELLEEVARIHAGEAADLASIRDRVIASGACEQARTRAEDYSKRALRALESLPDVAAREMLINVTTQLMLRLS